MIQRAIILILASIATCARADETLRVYSAAGLKRPVEAIAEAYRDQYGVRIELQFAGSGTLLNNMRIARRGDLYVAAEWSYMLKAREQGLVREAIPVAVQTPVIAVREGNPKDIRSMDDVLRSDVRLALATPEAAAVGKAAQRALEARGAWHAVSSHARVWKPTVTDLANAVRLGAIDAAILWDSTVAMFDGLEAVPVAELSPVRESVAVGVLESSEDPTEALRFARFLAARDRGQRELEKLGFRTLPGDAWEERPIVTLYAGSMFNAIIDERVSSFERREGVKVERVYNGCGILVAQMRAGAWPDAYFACDEVFMEDVSERFGEWSNVAENRLVIAVRKGNPMQIESLEDLAEQRLKLGLAHPTQSALGTLTKNMLVAAGLHQRIMTSGNWRVDSPTGDFLAGQLRAGSLDAIICYASNVLASERMRQHVDIIEIDRSDSVARQPYAVLANSKHPRLMERLLDAITDRPTEQRFRGAGFEWKLDRDRAPGPPVAADDPQAKSH